MQTLKFTGFKSGLLGGSEVRTMQWNAVFTNQKSHRKTVYSHKAILMRNILHPRKRMLPFTHGNILDNNTLQTTEHRVARTIYTHGSEIARVAHTFSIIMWNGVNLNFAMSWLTFVHNSARPKLSPPHYSSLRVGCNANTTFGSVVMECTYFKNILQALRSRTKAISFLLFPFAPLACGVSYVVFKTDTDSYKLLLPIYPLAENCAKIDRRAICIAQYIAQCTAQWEHNG